MRIGGTTFTVGRKEWVARQIVRFQPVAARAGTQPLASPFIADVHHHFIFDKILAGIAGDQACPGIDVDAAQKIL